MAASQDRFVEQRSRMVEQDLRARGVRDRNVLRAMGTVPREVFVEQSQRASAYEDHPLPIGEGQTISQPYIVALTLEAAKLRPSDYVLDIGTGSGYAAAVLSRMVAGVVSVERHGSLAEDAARKLADLGYDNVRVITGDGTLGFAEGAPYDAILAAAAADGIPEPWFEQVKPGGSIVVPVGHGWGQRLQSVRVRADGQRDVTDLGGVAFVPLIGSNDDGSDV